MTKTTIAKRFGTAMKSYDDHAHAQKHICQTLAKLLASVPALSPSRILEIGAGTGQLTRQLSPLYGGAIWDISDLCFVLPHLPKNLSLGTFYQGDFEKSPLQSAKQRYELIVSASTVQWFDNPQGFVATCHQLLKDKGYLLVSTFSPENLWQLKTLTGVGLSYPSLDDWQAWLDGFDVLALEQTPIDLYFDTAKEVLIHLKKTGVTGLDTAWTKSRLQAFYRDYEHYRTKDGLPLTYAPIYILAQKRQQQ